MSLNLDFLNKVFTALFAIMNPVANVPVFPSLTDGATDAERRNVAVTVCDHGVDRLRRRGRRRLVDPGPVRRQHRRLAPRRRAAGAAGAADRAVDAAWLGEHTQHASTEQERKDATAADNGAIHPLAISLLLGPGTSATMIVLGHNAVGSDKELAFAAGLMAFLLLLAVFMLSAPFIGHYLSR